MQEIAAEICTMRLTCHRLKVVGFQVFLLSHACVSLFPIIKSLCVLDYLDYLGCVLDYLDCGLDYLDGEEKAGNFSFCAYCIPVVELPLEIILP